MYIFCQVEKQILKISDEQQQLLENPEYKTVKKLGREPVYFFQNILEDFSPMNGNFHLVASFELVYSSVLFCRKEELHRVQSRHNLHNIFTLFVFTTICEKGTLWTTGWQSRAGQSDVIKRFFSQNHGVVVSYVQSWAKRKCSGALNP